MFKQVYSGLFIGSTILGVTGLVQYWKTEGPTQTLALTVGIAGTSSALVCAGLGIAYDGRHQSQQRDLDAKIQDIEQVRKAEMNSLSLEIRNLKSTISTLETQGTQYTQEIVLLKAELNLKAEQYLKILAEKDLKISKLEGIVSQRDTRVADFLEDSRGYVANFLNLRYQSLDSLQKTLEKALTNDSIVPFNAQSFDKRILDIRELKAELSDALREIRELEITDFKVVLDFIFKFDNKFLNLKVRWKDLQAKEVKNENVGLKTSLAESMPTSVAKERFRERLDDFDQQLTEKYETLLLNNNSIHSELLNVLEQRNLLINQLQQQNEVLQGHLENPFEMYGGSHYAENANKIAKYYSRVLKGKKLDCLDWEETDVGYKLLFSIRRNPSITLNELKEQNAVEQIAFLAQALDGTMPEFTIHSHNATVSLNIQTRRKAAKKDNSKDDIDKIWIPASKFESYFRTWERVRITAGSTGGKSPTAKNLALAIMKSRKGVGDILLYDPRNGSKKDFWNMPKAGVSHEENWQGMNAAADLVEQRGNSTGHRFKLYIFDEIDNTVLDLQKGSAFKDVVKKILKEGSHGDVGAIFIGQSVDANEIPGMTHSNWNNAGGLHMGSNAGLAINKLESIPMEQKTKLLEQYAKIQEYCDHQNADLGLDVMTDPCAYRFALAVPLSGLPKFIQLPDYDSYEYDEVISINTQNRPFLNNLDEVSVEEILAKVPQKIACPDCGSTSCKKNGKDKIDKSIQRYKCSACGNGFSDLDLLANSN